MNTSDLTFSLDLSTEQGRRLLVDISNVVSISESGSSPIGFDPSEPEINAVEPSHLDDETLGGDPSQRPDMDKVHLAEVDVLCEENGRLRRAGCEMANAAMRVEYDGVHSLMRAVSLWADAMAGQHDDG